MRRVPKVAPEHLESRRRQILDAAMALFARQGFAATSMQQITAASGMSAGAVYHYFPTKQSLVDATGEQLAAAYRAPLADLLAHTDDAPDPAEVVRSIGTGLERLHRDGGVDFTRIGIFTWAEALRDPDIAEGLRHVRARLCQALAPLVTAWQADGRVGPDATVEEVVAVLYGLMPGLTLQLNLADDVTADGYARGAAALFGQRG